MIESLLPKPLRRAAIFSAIVRPNNGASFLSGREPSLRQFLAGSRFWHCRILPLCDMARHHFSPSRRENSSSYESVTTLTYPSSDHELIWQVRLPKPDRS